MRNLFASQRKRILKSTTMKRAEQRRMIGQITDAAEAHAADVEESANMYSYLVGGTATTKKSMARPRTAGGSRARAKGSADESKRIRPTTASSTSIVQRSGSSRPSTNVYDYPTVEQKNDNVKKFRLCLPMFTSCECLQIWVGSRGGLGTRGHGTSGGSWGGTW